MNTVLEAEARKCLFNYWCLLLLAGGCLLLSILAGLLSALDTAVPELFDKTITLRSLRPAHTLFSLTWILAGPAAVVGIFGVRLENSTLGLSRAQLVLVTTFLAGAIATTLAGQFSGREYITWPPVVTMVLVFALALTPVTVLWNWRAFTFRSPEAGWLLLTGSLLVPLGLVEEGLRLHHVLGLAADPGRDLTVQWHALDTVIAGWSMVLYGIGILLTGSRVGRLRGGWLFALAAIGILADFGHHNYASPQAHVIKIVSFSATMLAVVSFVRHVAACRRARPTDQTMGMLRFVEFWTLFAVGTGVLLAIPPINLYAHGTYVIVAHTMGSMIGVNSLLLLAAGFRLSGVESWFRSAAVRATSYGLLGFCLVLAALGIARGVLRVDHDFLEWKVWLKPYLVLIMFSAIPLTLGLTTLAVDFVRCCVRSLRTLPADDFAMERVILSAATRKDARESPKQVHSAG